MKTFVCVGTIETSALLLASCKGKSKPMETPVPPISVPTPIMGDITLTKEYSGYLSSQLKVGLVARVNGYLCISYLKAGDRVKKGGLIFVIEPDTHQDNVTQTEAPVKTSKTQLGYVRSNYECMKEATKSSAVSQIQVIRTGAIVSESEVVVKNAKAESNTAQTNLSYCYIRAPFDSAVTRASYDIGSYINGAVQPVTSTILYRGNLVSANLNIEDNQFMKVMLEAARNDSTVKPPTKTLVSIGKDSSNAYTGRLGYLSPNIGLSIGILNVRANLDNPKYVLKSGLYVTVALPYTEQPNTVLVRDVSIGTDRLGEYLYIVNNFSVVRYRPIEVGRLVDDTLRQVTTGINPRDSYVASVLLKV